MGMPNLIGLIGKAGSGKDTVAGFLVEKHGFAARLAFADKLKVIIADAFDVPLEHFNDRDKKNLPHPNLTAAYISRKFNSQDLVSWFEAVIDDLAPERMKVSTDTAASAIFHNLLPHDECVSPRRAAQLIGTEGFRNLVHNSIWVDYLLRRALEIVRQGGRVVISDIRFRDEFDAVRQSGGIIMALHRDAAESHDHTSEDIGDLMKRADFTVMNNGTIDYLCTIAELQLSNEKTLGFTKTVAQRKSAVMDLLLHSASGALPPKADAFVRSLSADNFGRVPFMTDAQVKWLDDIWRTANGARSHGRPVTNKPLRIRL